MTDTERLTKLRDLIAAIARAVAASIEEEKRLSDQVRRREGWR